MRHNSDEISYKNLCRVDIKPIEQFTNEAPDGLMWPQAYAILGVEPEISDSDLTKAYKV